MHRRTLLAITAAALGTSIAGCTGGDGADDDGTSNADDGETDADGGGMDGGSEGDGNGDAGGETGAGTNEEGGGDDGQTDGGGDTDADVRVRWNHKRFERLDAPGNENWYFESNEEDEYIGVQFEVTNLTDSAVEIGQFELEFLADGNSDDALTHGQSQTDAYSSLEAGETVDAWLIVIVPPGAAIDLQASEHATHMFAIERDESLEVELEEYDG